MNNSRRDFLLKGLAAGATLASSPFLLPKLAFAKAGELIQPAGLPSGTLSSAVLEALEGKKPLIKRSYRPPNYETPVEYFNSALTPNDAFFVRWHLANIPEVKIEDWKLKIHGEGLENDFELTFDQLKKDYPAVEVTAVCQCSGNRRGLSEPHVSGVEWGYGAMGNAKWKGVRLKDILAKAGVKKDAVEVGFNGGDKAPTEKTPDFIKTIPVSKAMDENVLIAYEMNGEAIPHWNGYPARIVVPGWTATYWVKQLTHIEVLKTPSTNFWMNPAYRIPKNKFALVEGFPSQETATNQPITEMVVNSLITNLHDGQKVKSKKFEVKGVAWDGGSGITSVDVSIDGGKTWTQAKLGDDMGRFSWRQFTFSAPTRKGKYVVMARATNKIGSTQTADLNFNPAGYHNNVMQKLNITVA